MASTSKLSPLATEFNYSVSIPKTPTSFNDQTRAHMQSPYTRDNSTSSDCSFDSILPSIRGFKNIHRLVHILSLTFCVFLFSALAYWRQEVGWLDFCLGVTGWLASEALKKVVFETFTFPSKNGDIVVKGSGLGLPTTVHSALQELLRLGSIIMSVALLPETITPSIFTSMPPIPSQPNMPRKPLPPLDALFFSALWLALGWSFVEIVFASKEFWRLIKLYDDVLEETSEFDELEEGRDWDEEEEIERGREQEEQEEYVDATGRTEVSLGYGSTALTSRIPTAIESEVPVENKSSLHFLNSSAFDSRVTNLLDREEEEVEAEIRIRRIEREELEATLGVPLYALTSWVVLIWRLDAILLSIVLSLLLALPFRTTPPTLLLFPLWPTLFASIVIHVSLSLLWILGIKKAGIPAIGYATLVTLLAALFAVLALWGALE